MHFGSIFESVSILVRDVIPFFPAWKDKGLIAFGNLLFFWSFTYKITSSENRPQLPNWDVDPHFVEVFLGLSGLRSGVTNFGRIISGNSPCQRHLKIILFDKR